MKHYLYLTICLCIFVLCNGCMQKAHFVKEPCQVVAEFAPAAICLDGKLNEPAWDSARVYKLQSTNSFGNGQVEEPGDVRLLWDKKYLYIGTRFSDSDIVAEGQQDQLHHYQLGDVAEVFLKPEDKTWYWELYATPTGRKSSFWFPGRGRLGLPSCFDYVCGLAVGAQTVGTVNNWNDVDKVWTAEIAMPISDLTARGEKFEPGAKWRILIARYNYSRYLNLKGPELTSFPDLTKADFHLISEYGILKLNNKSN